MMIESSQNSYPSPPPTLPCPKCGEFMAMSRLVMGAPGQDERTFECRRCAVQETIAVCYQPTRPPLKA
jgi:hypothetical protein